MVQKGIGRQPPPYGQRVKLSKSLLIIIQKKIFEEDEANPLWPMRLPPRILGIIAQYAPASFPIFNSEGYKAWKDGASQEQIDRCWYGVMNWSYVKNEDQLMKREMTKKLRKKMKMKEWNEDWLEGMKPYDEQLQTWKELQDYDTKEEMKMVTTSDYKLGILDRVL
eukprot:TRINITY_DN11808_c0_g1_i1.p1 TRINITY_DN11808_c0_g1~~TRINITY_DN11808_c0_g1_i1.p1  ORF type:complete len:166 (-),score=36.94 TRINITY_DN11808_c0_g1_i1:78-575(-)